MSTVFEQRYRNVIEVIFNNWGSLRLAVEQGMAGGHGHQIAIEIMNYIYEYCIRNDNITTMELQELFEEIMDQEFNAICEDGSIGVICHHILRYKELCVDDEEYKRVMSELAMLPEKTYWLTPNVKIVPKKTSDESSSEDDQRLKTEAENVSSMDVDVDGDENEDGDESSSSSSSSSSPSPSPSPSSNNRGKNNENDNNKIEEEEPGWTVVHRSHRKKH